MGKFKKIKILPLLNFENLNLNLGTKKSYDLTHLNKDELDSILQKIHKIISETTGVIVGTKIGEEVFVASKIKGSENKRKAFYFPEPNPITIYYSTSIDYLEKSYKQKNKFFSTPQHFNYNYNYSQFIEYYSNTSQGVISLITTLEGFINQIIPENFSIENNDKILQKKDILWLDINTKIKQILPMITGIDFSKSNISAYEKICLTIALRNDLIHLKSSIDNNLINYRNLFKRLLDFDQIGCSESIFSFVNTFIPNYFKLI